MAAPDRWAELGIAPTADRTAIRRAYAARLKTVRPDEDPQGFTRLRSAYEAALAMAEAPPVRNAPPPEAPPEVVAETEREEAPTLPDTDARATAAVDTCLERGDLVGAASALAEARAEGLSLSAGERLFDRIGWTLVDDEDVPLRALLAAAERLGPAGADTTWGPLLRDKLAAERWFAELNVQATSRWRWVGASSALAARIMLGRGPLRTVASMGRDVTLRRRYGEYLLHAPTVRDRFDPERIQSVSDLIAGKGGVAPSRLLFWLWVLIVAAATGASVSESGNGLLAFGGTFAGLYILVRLASSSRRLAARLHRWLRRRPG